MRWPELLVAFVLGFLLSYIAHTAVAHSQGVGGYPTHPPPSQYDPYIGIRNKDGVNCCNGQDCHLAVPDEMFDIRPEGGYIIRSTGEQITEGQVANSPDGNWHICRRFDLERTVRCLMVPVGGS